VEHFWQLRLQDLQTQLNSNNFQAFVVKDSAEAERLIMDKLVPESKAESASHGGSMTLMSTKVLNRLSEMDGIELIRLDEPNLSNDEKMERRRRGLLVDLYLSGTNAVTEDGHLVNLDMIGNRVGAITFGPKKVIILVGRNKIVPDLESAMYRIKDYAATTNTIRLDMKTPCAKTSICADCKSPQRICNYWTITEKSFPKERIAVILINEDLGL
jgi:L-lactate utilization protein LutB